MQDAIENFAKQFEFTPKIENGESLKKATSFVIGGMGGSHLAADLLFIYDKNIPLLIHRDYGLPRLSKTVAKSSLYIASSYSGNTEEILDFAKQALLSRLSLAIIAVGGELIDFAVSNNIPYIKLPNTGIQPRSALGFSLLALTHLIRESDTEKELSSMSSILDPKSQEKSGEELAVLLSGKIPVVYSSSANAPIGYNWKIKFNETAKIPSFQNVFPELNHNEMAGMDGISRPKKLSDNFYFIFLSDSTDHPRIQKRMEITKKLYIDRGLVVTTIDLFGKTISEKIFNSLLLADWTAFYLSKIYSTEPDKVAIVEEFKKLI